jgi:hypothetical protein
VPVGRFNFILAVFMVCIFIEILDECSARLFCLGTDFLLRFEPESIRGTSSRLGKCGDLS